jgi:hypothetical protein
VSTIFFLAYFLYFIKIRVSLWDHLVLWWLEGCTWREYILVCFPDVFLLPTLLTLMFLFICSLFNVICPSLVFILNEVSVVSTLPSVSTLVISRQQLCKHIPRPLLVNGFVNVSRSLLGSGLVNTFLGHCQATSL